MPFSTPPPPLPPHASPLPPQLSSWDFNVFVLSRVSGRRSLVLVTFYALERLELIDGLQLQREHVVNYAAVSDSTKFRV